MTRPYPSEPLPEPDRSATSDRQLLVGIDAPLSAQTHYALKMIGWLVAPSFQHVHVLLLQVILAPYVGGRQTPTGHFPPTSEERKRAEEALQAACIVLQQHGMPRTHIEM